jgi:hypothetical protein
MNNLFPAARLGLALACTIAGYKPSLNFRESKLKKAPRYSPAIARPVTALVCAIHNGRLICEGFRAMPAHVLLIL